MTGPGDDTRNETEPAEREGRSGVRRAHAGDDYRMPETQEILERVIGIIDSAPGIPMSSSVRVNREDLMELLDDAVRRLPDELRSARWLLKEREEFLSRARRESDDIKAEARANAAHMAQRSEVAKAAEAYARQVTEEADADARRMRREAEDYCDQKLASFENVLTKILRAVAAGRDRLAAPTIEEAELGDLGEPRTGSNARVFDQEP